MEKTQPHPITHRELCLTMMIVVVVLGQLLGLKETLTNLSKHLVTSADEVTRNLRPSCLRIHRKYRRGWSTIDHLKWT